MTPPLPLPETVGDWPETRETWDGPPPLGDLPDPLLIGEHGAPWSAGAGIESLFLLADMVFRSPESRLEFRGAPALLSRDWIRSIRAAIAEVCRRSVDFDGLTEE